YRSGGRRELLIPREAGPPRPISRPARRRGINHAGAAAMKLFLLSELVRRDFQSRYAGSALGFLWSFALPVWQLLLYTFVFSGILDSSLQGERTERFALFLFSGLLLFMAVSEGISRATTAVTDNAPLVKKLRFPIVLLVVTVIATALVHEAIALALFWVVLAVL